MAGELYWACADVLSLGARLSTARDLPPPDVLQRRIEGLLDQMARKARDAGATDADVADAKYALVAYLDEQILKSPWPGRQQWLANPLQLVHFHENTAGEGFYVRMEQLRQQPQRAHVLEVYFLCVSLGFQGIYAVRGDSDALAAIQENAGAYVLRTLPSTDTISPHGDPKDARRGLSRRDAPIVALGVASLVLAVLAFFVLRFVVTGDADSAANTMKATPAASAAPGTAGGGH